MHPRTPSPSDIRRLQDRTVRLLFGTQVLGGVGTATGVAVATVTLAVLSGSDAVGGLGQTALVTGTALAALPLAALAGRAGRRPALAGGFLCAALGAAMAVLAVQGRNWPLLLASLVLFGTGNAAALASRYAAADLAEPGRRARQLSLVLWATTVGSLLGPNLAAPARTVAADGGLAPLSGPFALAALAFLAAALVIWLGLRPDPLLTARLVEERPAAPPRGTLRAALRAVRASPELRLALLGVAVAQAVMVALMAMTPVHLHHAEASLGAVGLLMSLHLGAMYAFSPLVGAAVDRVGARGVLLGGCGVLGASAAVFAVADAGQVATGVALVLLGLGWSCGLVSASTLVTERTAPEARPAVQGASDLTLSAASVLASAGGGLVVAAFSFRALALACGALLALLAARCLAATADGTPRRAR